MSAPKIPFKWAVAANFDVAGDAWDNTANKASPPDDVFRPQRPPAAQYMNYIFNAMIADMTRMRTFVTSLPANNWPYGNVPTLPSGTLNKAWQLGFDTQTNRRLVMAADIGAGSNRVYYSYDNGTNWSLLFNASSSFNKMTAMAFDGTGKMIVGGSNSSSGLPLVDYWNGSSEVSQSLGFSSYFASGGINTYISAAAYFNGKWCVFGRGKLTSGGTNQVLAAKADAGTTLTWARDTLYPVTFGSYATGAPQDWLCAQSSTMLLAAPKASPTSMSTSAYPFMYSPTGETGSWGLQIVTLHSTSESAVALGYDDANDCFVLITNDGGTLRSYSITNTSLPTGTANSGTFTGTVTSAAVSGGLYIATLSGGGTNGINAVYSTDKGVTWKVAALPAAPGGVPAYTGGSISSSFGRFVAWSDTGFRASLNMD